MARQRAMPGALLLALQLASAGRRDACEHAPIGSYPDATNCTGAPATLPPGPREFDAAPFPRSSTRAHGRRLVPGYSPTFVKHKHDGHGSFSLGLDEILFIVMSSNALPQRALWASKTWCSYNASRCIYVADKPICDSEGGGCLETIEVSPNHRPKHCCKRDPFFCNEHRQATLRAQYRFLPALAAVKASAEFASGQIKWVLIVDDDSWVFTSNLLDLLKRFPHQVPLYLGDFVRQPGASFACGGGGSVLSRALVDKMAISRCISALQWNCMQSDWMISYCAAHAHGQYVKNYGCDTCRLLNAKSIAQVKKRLRRQCFFMQNSGAFMNQLRPAQRGYPAILHAYRATKRKLWRWFLKTGPDGLWLHRANVTRVNGTWVNRTGGGGGAGVPSRGELLAAADAGGGAADESVDEDGGLDGAGSADEPQMPVPELTEQMIASMAGGDSEHAGGSSAERWPDGLQGESDSADPVEQLRYHALSTGSAEPRDGGEPGSADGRRSAARWGGAARDGAARDGADYSDHLRRFHGADAGSAARMADAADGHGGGGRGTSAPRSNAFGQGGGSRTSARGAPVGRASPGGGVGAGSRAGRAPTSSGAALGQYGHAHASAASRSAQGPGSGSSSSMALRLRLAQALAANQQ